ncbi:MAG: hypothetical protein HYW98_00505 [Candidatus Wildermuthbacteria bacterium]|nr:hypothetical protein [Candidatus Wildermuthbacteria bacterium]MBI2647813.1 hypothetical protein [Candidatus Wildermuthbacteria bacterium]
MKEDESKEMLELLKRAEIRTMTKDIAMVRKEEAKKERERITTIRVTHEQAPNLSRAAALPAVKPPKTPDSRKAIILSRPQSRAQKIVVRVLLGGIVILGITNLALFIYWYFIARIL